MNVYSPFLRSLTPSQRLAAKVILTSLQEVNHPHICRVLGVVDSPSELSVRCESEGPSVLQLHQAQSSSWRDEDLARQFLGIVAGLSKTQSKVSFRQRIAHGQLMLEALYLDGEEKMKVVGFGTFSGSPENCAYPCPQLSPVYRSPEIKERKPFNAYKADLFALGVCFLQLGTCRTIREPETLEALVNLANGTGSKLSPLLKLVFRPEGERPDCLEFKEQSGYCEHCWANIDQGQPICGACPKAMPAPKAKEANPLNFMKRMEQPLPSAAVVQNSLPRRKLQVQATPEPQKCRKCQRELRKINEKDICRLCLIKEKVPDNPPEAPAVAVNAAPVIPKADPGKIENKSGGVPARPEIPKVAQNKPVPVGGGFVPGHPKAGPGFGAPQPVGILRQGPPLPAVPGQAKEVSFPQDTMARQETPGYSEGGCQVCGRKLSRKSRWGGQMGAEGYDEFCSEGCIEKYVAFISETQATQEISCLECGQPGSSEWIKLPCNEGHRLCSNACASIFVKRAMGPNSDMSLVICPKCKAQVPQDLVQRWKSAQSNNPGALQPFR